MMRMAIVAVIGLSLGRSGLGLRVSNLRVDRLLEVDAMGVDRESPR